MPQVIVSQTAKIDSMRPIVVFVWQSLVVESYRSFFYRLAEAGNIEVILIAPRRFRELGSQTIECTPFKEINNCSGISVTTYAAHTQAVWYRGLWRILRNLSNRKAPITVVSMAEPYSLTSLGCWLQARIAIRRPFQFGCFALQNIHKRFSIPIRLTQWFCFIASDFILALGNEHEQVLRTQGYSGKCLSFPLWFDSDRFKPENLGSAPFKIKSESQKVQLGFIGSLLVEKGILDFLDCIEDYLRSSESPQFEIRIAGNGPLAEPVACRVANMRQQGVSISYIGPLPGKEVPEFFQNLDILVVPSLTTQHWKEQFGRVITEAMACGCTVIGSSSGEIPQLISDLARIFPEGDLAQMAKALISWGTQISQYSQLIREGNVAAAARFSDRNCALEFAKLLAP